MKGLALATLLTAVVALICLPAQAQRYDPYMPQPGLPPGPYDRPVAPPAPAPEARWTGRPWEAAFAPDATTIVFYAIDRDGDGRMTPREIDDFADAVRRADADDRGFVTQAQFHGIFARQVYAGLPVELGGPLRITARALYEARRLIARHDLIGDGVVSRGEWTGSRDDFDRYDTDRNGVITLHDFARPARIATADPRVSAERARDPRTRARIVHERTELRPPVGRALVDTRSYVHRGRLYVGQGRTPFVVPDDYADGLPVPAPQPPPWAHYDDRGAPSPWAYDYEPSYAPPYHPSAPPPAHDPRWTRPD